MPTLLPPPPSSRWTVTAEYLYLLPSIDDTYFVIDSPANVGFPNGKRRNNDFNFTSGFRVGGAYEFCDNSEIQIYYSHLNAHESKTVNGANLWASLLARPDFEGSFRNYAGLASSSLDLRYRRVDGFFAQEVLSSCRLQCDVLIGLEYAYTHLQEDYIYQRRVAPLNIGEINEKSGTQGIGPQLGVDFDYRLCQFSFYCPGALSLTSHASGSILASQTKTEIQSRLLNTGNFFLNVADEHTWRLIPALHARVGLNYAISAACFGFSLEVGYEFNTYIRGLARQKYPDEIVDSLCFTNYYNFDIQGLYAAGSITF